MALIDTAMAGTNWLEHKEEMVQSLRLALVEELAAANTYEKLAYAIGRSGMPDHDFDGNPVVVPEDRLTVQEAKNLCGAILEIKDDELTHTGKLMRIIDMLSPETARLVEQGRNEA